MPLAQNRARHLRAVSTQTPSSSAIVALDAPSEAINTINARSIIFCGALPARTRACSSVRSASQGRT